MGYSTEFKGLLKFSPNVTVAELQALGGILGEDRREHPEWKAPGKFHYIDLQISKNLAGLEWNGAESSYGMEYQVATVIRVMQQEFPHFTLHGRLDAQGDDADDRWCLILEGADIFKRVFDVTGTATVCPDCGHAFVANQTIGPEFEQREIPLEES